MKLFSKVAVLAAALMVVSVFAGCKNAEDEGDGVVALYNGYLDGTKKKFPARLATGIDYEKPVLELKFYDDNTFDVITVQGEEAEFANGTYKGDPAKDGDIDITFKEMVNMKSESTELLPVDKDSIWNNTYKIIKGELYFYRFKFIREE